MGHYHRVIGGRWVSTEAWLGAARDAGCRCEVHPLVVAPLERVQAEVPLRFGHAALGPRDYLVWMDVERHVPPMDAPPEAVERYRERLETLLALGAPMSVTMHARFVVAALDSGPPAVVEVLRASLADAVDDYERELIETQIEMWSRAEPVPQLEQEWLLRVVGGGTSEVAHLAGWAMAAAYAQVARGEHLEAPRPLGREQVVEELDAIRDGLRHFGVEPSAAPLAVLESWDHVDLDDEI